MMRTTITLPNELYHRLKMTSYQEGKKITKLVRELLGTALSLREHNRLQTTYDVLKELDGLGGKNVTDASTTINTLLYGDGREHGA